MTVKRLRVMRYLICTLLALSLAAPPAFANGYGALAALELKALETEAELRSLRVQQEMLQQHRAEYMDALAEAWEVLNQSVLAAVAVDNGSDEYNAAKARGEPAWQLITESQSYVPELNERREALEQRVKEKSAELIGLRATLEAHRETQQAAPPPAQPARPGYMPVEQDHTFQ